MKPKIPLVFRHFFLSAVVSLAIAGCAQLQEQTSEVEQKSSELALLMRQLHEDSKLMKAIIESNDDLSGHFPEYVKGLKTAEPTDQKVVGENFNAMSDNYVYNLEQLFSADKNNQKEQFNLVVQSCIKCHRSFCPGPIKTIKKLKIKLN